MVIDEIARSITPWLRCFRKNRKVVSHIYIYICIHHSLVLTAARLINSRFFFFASERYYSQLPGSVETPIFPYRALFIVYSVRIKTEADLDR